jgi:dTMP kinase
MISTYLTSHSTTTPTLSDHSIHLLFSANRWESSTFITSTLSSGYTLICDRYTHSGIVYSAAKGLPNLDLDWARQPDVGLPKPDVVVFLDLEPEEAEKRGGFGEERYEKREFQGRVRKEFLGLVGREGEGIRRVDAGKGVEEVGERVLGVVAPVVDAVEKGEIGELGVIGK